MTQGMAVAGATFCRYDLRTTDPQAAAKFYSEVAGLDLAGASSSEPSMLAVWPLHEQARARGAPPHWLGQIGVADVDATAAKWVERGSERLGPTVRAHDGAAFTNLRDPSGAVVALRADTRRPQAMPVAWHQLHTRDLARAWIDYSELFGWVRNETRVTGDPATEHVMFAWDPSGKSMGSMGNTARWPGVRAHWLFYFPVADLDDALVRVKGAGGHVIASHAALPSGGRLAPCEDPQGAAFGLCHLTPLSG